MLKCTIIIIYILFLTLALLAAEHILEFVLLNLFRMTEKGVQKEITEIEGSQKRRGIL